MFQAHNSASTALESKEWKTLYTAGAGAPQPPPHLHTVHGAVPYTVSYHKVEPVDYNAQAPHLEAQRDRNSYR